VSINALEIDDDDDDEGSRRLVEIFIITTLFNCIDYVDWNGRMNVNWKQRGRKTAVKVLF
jgi:hypothetical protein